MSAQVAVTTAQATDVLTIPSVALRRHRGNYSVHVLDETGQAQRAGHRRAHRQRHRRDPDRPDRGRERRDRDDRSAARQRTTSDGGLGGGLGDLGGGRWARGRFGAGGGRWHRRERRRRHGHGAVTLLPVGTTSRRAGARQPRVPAGSCRGAGTPRTSSMTVWRGEFVAIVGQSGSGKSHAHEHRRLPRPADVGRLPPRRRARLLAAGRHARVGPQPHDRLRLPVVQPAAARRPRSTTSRRRCCTRAWAARSATGAPRRPWSDLGLGDRLHHEPTELSGGQQQRVADRAGAGDRPRAAARRRADRQPRQSHSGADVMALFRELHAAGRTIVLITHDASVRRGGLATGPHRRRADRGAGRPRR